MKRRAWVRSASRMLRPEQSSSDALRVQGLETKLLIELLMVVHETAGLTPVAIGDTYKDRCSSRKRQGRGQIPRVHFMTNGT